MRLRCQNQQNARAELRRINPGLNIQRFPFAILSPSATTNAPPSNAYLPPLAHTFAAPPVTKSAFAGTAKPSTGSLSFPEYSLALAPWILTSSYLATHSLIQSFSPPLPCIASRIPMANSPQPKAPVMQGPPWSSAPLQLSR